MDNRHEYIIKDSKNGEFFIFNDNKIKRKNTENIIKNMNNNSYFVCDFLSPYDDDIIKKLQAISNECIDNFMSSDFYSDGICWIFSGYPHDECDSYLTNITFSSTNYNVFGIKSGDKLHKSKIILENNGFTLSKKEKMEWKKNLYENYDLYISFSTILDDEIKDEFVNIENIEIKSIEIEVKTFYLGNRIY